MQESKTLLKVTPVLIIIAALAVSLPGAFSTGPLWPDGQRYTFNGILLHDMIRDGEIFNPIQYNVKFYAKYPATNLPYGPPFFALVFAVAFSIFGISFSVARVVVSIYTALAALMCWYLFYRISKNYWISVLAVSALLFNPLTAIYSRDITPEMAVAFHSFLTIYFFYNYVEYEKKYFGIYAALAFGLGYLTKQYVIPLGVVPPVYIIIRRKWDILFKKETLISIFIIGALVVPYTLLTFKYAKNELEQHVPVSLNLMLAYPRVAIMNLPVIPLIGIFGLMLGIWRKERLSLLCLIWAVCWYGFFTFFISNQDEKYFSSFVPVIVYPFGIAVDWIVTTGKRVYLSKVFIIMIILFFVHGAVSRPVYYARGYEKAGEYIAKNPLGSSVLYYGNCDGSFMLGVRRNQDGDGPYVLRGDRQLAVRVSYGNAKQSVNVESTEDIIKILEKYQTGYVVVEREMPKAKEFQEYDLLIRALERKDLFEWVAGFQLRTNYRELGPELAIYKFNYYDRSNKAKTLTIPVPTLKEDLKVTF